MRIVIIEDERLIANELKTLLLATSKEVTVKALLSSVKEAASYFANEHGTDLVFSDVQLTDGLSFDIFNTVHCDAPVVFISGFDQYITNSFENNGIDYLLKPVDEKDLLKVLHKYKMLDQHFTKRNQFFNSFAKEKKRLVVKKGLSNILLRLEDIVLFYTENKVTYCIDKEEKKYLCDQNLGELEEELCNVGFFRANRQYIVNAEYIRGYKTYDKVKLQVDLLVSNMDQPIVVSQETAPHFRRWMNEI